MKKYFLFALTLLISVMFYSCGDNSTNPTSSGQKGNIYITSSPSGAQIWNNNTNTNKVTPDSLTGLDAGTYSITLKSQGLRDTTISVTVNAGETTRLNVKMPISTVTYSMIRLYETTGTTAQQPSGLILSTGQPSGISSTAPDRAKVDLYYSSSGFVLASADQNGLPRVTYFKIGSSSTLSDTASAPAYDQTWVKKVNDTENNYIFVYDNDQHYSKIQIANRGGGTPNNPAWVDINVIYNKQAGDRRF